MATNRVRDPQVQELIQTIRTLILTVQDGVIDADEGGDLCRAAASLLQQVAPNLPRWWMRSAVIAAVAALHESAIFLDNIAGVHDET